MNLMSATLEAFRDNLMEILERRGISMTQLADDLDMSRPALSRVLNGHSGITLDRADKIARYLEVPLPRLLRIREKVG